MPLLASSRILGILGLTTYTLLFSTGIVCASTPADALKPVNLDDIAAKLATYFQAIKSVDVKYETGTPGRPNRTLHWVEEGDKYRFDWVQLDPRTPLANKGAYDGQNYQQIEPKNGILYLSQKPFEIRTYNFLKDDSFFATPFEWMVPRTLENSGYPVTMAEIQASGSFLKRLSLATNIIKTTKNSHPVVQMTLPGGVDWFFRKPYQYRVYFSIDQDYFPIGWDKINDDGKLVSDFHILEMGQAKIDDKTTILYPKVISSGYFFPEDVVDDSDWGKPHVNVVGITFNKAADEVFTIDPSTAKGIYESDTKKYIAVPK